MNSRRLGTLRRGTIASGLVLVLWLAGPAHADSAAPLTLQEAWRLAEQANPELRRARAGQIAVDAELQQAQSLLYNNPQVSGQIDQRHFTPISGAAGTSAIEWNLGLSQTFELPEKPLRRRQAAEQAQDAYQQRVEAMRRQVRSEVAQRFITVLALQQRSALEAGALRAVEQAEAATHTLVDSGELPLLQGNVAAVELERARNQLSGSQEELLHARAELATTLQLPPDQLPEVAGELGSGTIQWTLDRLLTGVADSPAQLELIQEAQAASSRLDYERAAARPDVTVSLSAGRGREIDTRDTVATLTVTVPLPLFDRNQARIGKAGAEKANAEIERDRHARDAQAEAVALWQRFQLQQQRVDRLVHTVLPRLEQNRALAQRSHAAGQLDLLQFLLVARQVSEAQREVLDARTELARTVALLDAIAGWRSP